MQVGQVRISDPELDELKRRLGAVLETYRGRSNRASDIDTLELSKSDRCQDLAGSAEFDEHTEGYEPASVVLAFAHESHGTVRLYVSTITGAVWFRAAVPEEVIDHVYSVVAAVKGL